MNRFLLTRRLAQALVAWCLGGVLALLGGCPSAIAGVLATRIDAFPHWQTKPPAAIARGDLVYPDWLAGTWRVESTLVDLVAPLAPTLQTPGFEQNRRWLDQPMTFEVRFAPSQPSVGATGSQIRPWSTQGIVADRRFNGLNLARAYLGDRPDLWVKTDPDRPDRQVTRWRCHSFTCQLVTQVTGRATESSSRDHFIATEISQQIFRGEAQIYFNEVETTTAYSRNVAQSVDDRATIVADQLTAIYLSPQDPDYFKAVNQPVALYRYVLKLFPL